MQAQVNVPVVYEGLRLEAGLRLDLLIDKQLIVEIKAVEEMSRLFKAQVLTYLRLTNLRLALLINFNVPLLRDGIRSTYPLPGGDRAGFTLHPRRGGKATVN